MSAPDQESRFLEMLNQHRKILLKIAGAYSRNAADRQDLLQETTIQLWHSFGRFDGRSQVSTWLYRVCLNVAISWSRHESRRGRRTEPLSEEVLASLPAADRLEQALADFDALATMLASLNELDRALVVLHLEGHGHEVMAEILGTSATNISTRLNRIKQRLRREFADCREEQPK